MQVGLLGDLSPGVPERGGDHAVFTRHDSGEVGQLWMGLSPAVFAQNERELQHDLVPVKVHVVHTERLLFSRAESAS